MATLFAVLALRKFVDRASDAVDNARDMLDKARIDAAEPATYQASPA